MGVPKLEQHQVRDVDHVGDRADTEAGDAVLQPQGRRADVDVDDDRCPVVRAALSVFHGDARKIVHDPGRDARRRLRRGELESEVVEGGELACDADVTERIGSVGRHPDLEDGVARHREGLEKRCPRDDGAQREHQNAVRVAAARRGEAHLLLRAQHALAGHAANVTGSDGHADCWQVRSERSQHDQPARFRYVGRAAHHPLERAATAIDGHEAQPRSGRVGLNGSNGRDHQRLEPSPELSDALHFKPGARELLGDLGWRGVETRNESA
jgi:hypothetical protein